MGARLAAVFALALLVAGTAGAQTNSPPGSEAPLSFKVLVDQIQALYPVIKTDVVEVTGDRVILAAGRAVGVQPGVELSTFREGRELYHPTTKKLLGRTEEPLGRVVIKEVSENYSVATLLDGKPPSPGDQALSRRHRGPGGGLSEPGEDSGR
jgi:flagellar biosynthesis/type III secretory pathway ATPase